MTKKIDVSDWDLEGLKELAVYALSHAKLNGATACEAGLSLSEGLSVNVRLGDVETLEHYRDRSLAITVYKGQRKGSATTNDLSKQSINASVEAACSIADFTNEDEYAGLADASLMAKAIPELDLHHPWNLTTEAAIDLATRCEDTARSVEGISNSEGASVTRYGGCVVYANSHGFVEGYTGSRHSISCSVIAGSNETMQRDYWYSSARNPEALESAEQIGYKAAQRAVARVGARKINTCQVPILFAPETARSLFGSFLSAINGSALYRRATFLLDKKGCEIFSPNISISEQPHILQAIGSAPYDQEGVATRRRDLVVDGVLQDYVLDSYSARKLGLISTGNAGGVHNLIVEAGQKTQNELLKDMDKGLLVTEMMGHGVNIVTGDYSRGAAGFWVENGEIQFPVEEITVAANLGNMFTSILALGNDVDRRSNVHCGSVLIDNMTVAGS